MSSDNASATVRVKLVRSPNSTPANHRLCVKALGLKRMHQVVELKDSPSVRGLINKVNYLVRVEG
ncbi:MAG: 50S ribosomal protein L30 [Rhodanobacteraceae bacterium]|nr:50S ribosomal protein L30 [Rhodanobacteraceae bacterium]